MGLYLRKRMRTPDQNDGTEQAGPVNRLPGQEVFGGLVLSAGRAAGMRGLAIQFAREDSTRGDGAPVWPRPEVSGRKRTGAPGIQSVGAVPIELPKRRRSDSCLLPSGRLLLNNHNERRGPL